MAGNTEKEVVADTSAEVAVKDTEKTKIKKKKGLFSRIWNGVFRLHGDDFEKRLQYITKEEALVVARMKKRAQSWRRTARHLIIFSVLLEVIAVGYAIMTTRSLDLNWQMRALRVLPMFLLPGLAFLTYSGLGSFTRMCDRKDQKTLERLRNERQEKIDELKEKTNYYTTQQLIQRYDPDPAAKAAAATVLASKLGADSGLNFHVGDDSKHLTGKSNDVELVQQTGGLRNRKQHSLTGGESGLTERSDMERDYQDGGGLEYSQHQVGGGPMVVEHFQPTGSNTPDGGWLAKLAALLVGEDPTQSYALICGNCHMHNGLARKEDFPFITYYCPHCNALNKPKDQIGQVSGAVSPNMSSSSTPHGGGGGGGEYLAAKNVSGGSPVSSVGATAGSTEVDKISTDGSDS